MAGLFSSIGFKTNEDWRSDAEKILQENGVPGETLIGYAFIQEKPSTGYIALIGPLFAFLIKYHLLILTNQRLIVGDTDALNKLKSFIPYSLKEIHLVKLSKGLLQTGLTLQFPDGTKRTFSFYKAHGGEQTAEKIANAVSGYTIDQLKGQEKVEGVVGSFINIFKPVIIVIGILFAISLLIILVSIFSVSVRNFNERKAAEQQNQAPNNWR